MFVRLRFAVSVLSLGCFGAAAVGQARSVILRPITPTNVISSCVNKTTGVPRLVASSANCNTTTEVFVQWNIKGVTGATGAQGPAGATGPAGSAGAKGATGAIGVQGPQGVAGAKGATGPIGPIGPAGPAGATGAKGATGAQGPQGLPGTVNPIPANITALSGALGTAGYSAQYQFNYPATCVLGDLILSANSYVQGALPADGRVMPINQNTALFSLLGTRFGGDGTTTFALPDMRAVTPQGLQYSICEVGIFPPQH